MEWLNKFMFIYAGTIFAVFGTIQGMATATGGTDKKLKQFKTLLCLAAAGVWICVPLIWVYEIIERKIKERRLKKFKGNLDPEMAEELKRQLFKYMK